MKAREYGSWSKVAGWLALVLALVLVAPASGQAPAEQDVVMGSWHLNSADVDEARRILVAMGGSAGMVGERPVVEFPGVTVYLTQKMAAAPTGGSAGTSVDHVGLWAKNVEAVVAEWQAAAVPVELARPTQAWVTTPDGLRIEILQNEDQPMPIQHHHIHYNVPSSAIADAQEWYNEVFGAIPGMRGRFDAADIPGANLTFSGVEEDRVGTRGRALHGVGFQVRGLDALCQRLQGRADVTFDRPCEQDPATGQLGAELTDPWGTVILLTEASASTE